MPKQISGLKSSEFRPLRINMLSRCKPVYRVFCKAFYRVRERCIYRTVYGCKVRNAEKCAFSRVFQLYVYEKRPRRIASSRSFTMRLGLAVFAKIAMDGCAPGHMRVTVQARLSCFVQSFLSSFRKDVFTEPSTAARSEMRKNVHFPVFFSSISTKKDLEELLLQGLLLCGSG